MRVPPFLMKPTSVAVLFGAIAAGGWIAYTAATEYLAPRPEPTPLFTAAPVSQVSQGRPPVRGFGRFRGGPFEQDVALVASYDTDGDGRLNTEERAAAREGMETSSRRRRGRRGGIQRTGGMPGPPLSPADVKWYRDEPFYDINTIRTLFLEFEEDDWEEEMEAFYHTDVEVPAKLTVDGRVYPEVGVGFRGNTSYSSVGTGWKRPLKISIDYADDDQRLGGYRTLNLLNSMADPTFLRIVLYMQIARDYLPAPKANFVRVVINGESWGIYVNVEQFNSDFLREWFGSKDGARWKTPGSPRGGGGLAYWGDDPNAYRVGYEIKTDDVPESWAALINFCRVLNLTPPDGLEKALAPLLDIDSTLRFLAIDKALINNDGYWTRASDYSIYMDGDGQFHVFPYDTNESFRPPEQGWGGRDTDSVEVDPFAGASNPEMPLLSKLLAVDSLRERYLSYLYDVAEKWLDWEKLGPLAERYQALISDDMASDTHNLYSLEDFFLGVSGEIASMQYYGGFTSPPPISLKEFVERRRAYLLAYRDSH